jgi:hypothetical protein
VVRLPARDINDSEDPIYLREPFAFLLEIMNGTLFSIAPEHWDLPVTHAMDDQLRLPEPFVDQACPGTPDTVE